MTFDPQMPSVVFMGTPEFARTVLKKIHEGGFHIKAVFAQPDKPAGRGQKIHVPPVAEYAREQKLALYQPQRLNNPQVLQELKKLSPDFIVAAAYGKLIPDDILSLAKTDSLNVHASLLPRFRGAAPIQHALLEDCKKTGVSIMRMVREMDAGPVFLAREIPITDDDNAITLTESLAVLGAEALVEAVNKILAGNIEPVAQDNERVSFAPKITRDFSPIDWNCPARDLFNQIRALAPWPAAATTMAGKALKIHDARPLEQDSQAHPGTVTHIGPQGLSVATATTDLLVREVQLEGKKRVKAFDLAHGLRLKPGAMLGL